MRLALVLTVLLAAPMQRPDPPAEPAQKDAANALKIAGPWLDAYSQAALALLDGPERIALEKLKRLGFHVEKRAQPAWVVVSRDGQLCVEAPRGIDLAYNGPPPAKAGTKPRLMKELAPLAELQHVEKLLFRHPNITDEMLDWLKRMRDIWYLDLGNTGITDAGLRKLAHMKRLRWLELAYASKITDSGFKALADLPALAYLNLTNTRVGNDGVGSLAKNVNLETLILANTPVGDAGLTLLAGLPLQTLVLSRTRITDKGLKAMAQAGCFARVANLDLTGTGITDAGLKNLHDPKALPKLRSLSVGGGGVTDDGIAAFQRARPDVFVPGAKSPPNP